VAELFLSQRGDVEDREKEEGKRGREDGAIFHRTFLSLAATELRQKKEKKYSAIRLGARKKRASELGKEKEERRMNALRLKKLALFQRQRGEGKKGGKKNLQTANR